MKNLVLFSFLFIFSCTSNNTNVSGTSQTTLPSLSQFKLSSPAFSEGGNIPSLYTCDSTNISPVLQWTSPPANVKSFALIMDDPDAPMGTWVHWVVYNIPLNVTSLQQKFPADTNQPGGICQGITSFHAYGYGGPCPPNGVHRYFFRLYALDTIFGLSCKTTGAKTLTTAMKGHILAETELMGKYQKRVKSEK